VNSWWANKLERVKDTHFKDIRHLRKQEGEGSFGTVYKAIDQTSGHVFAIKVVRLERYSGGANAARALLHGEIEVSRRLKHVSKTVHTTPWQC
jgi:serine/threonine protein kinase